MDKIEPGSNEWLIRRQKAYDKAIGRIAVGGDPSSRAAFVDHNNAVAEIDKLPISQGGYAPDPGPIDIVVSVNEPGNILHGGAGGYGFSISTSTPRTYALWEKHQQGSDHRRYEEAMLLAAKLEAEITDLRQQVMKLVGLDQ